MPKTKKPDFQKHLSENTILEGFVAYCERKKGTVNDDNEFICVNCQGSNVYILKKDAVLLPYSKSLSRLVGDMVKFCVIRLEEYGTPNEKIYGSMIQAKKILRAPVLEKLKNNEILTGRVINAVRSGAYIAVGDVSGLMKNEDFSDDGSEIRDYYQRGAEIKVRLKKIRKNGTVYFLPEEKRKGTTTVKIKDIKEGAVMSGNITHSYPDRVYVNVLPGIDALCFCPTNLGFLRDDDSVTVKITRIYEADGEPRVKGKILGKNERPITAIL